MREGGDIVIDVVDNGIGLPKESRSRLLEPYVTTREKGTGLGLAISRGFVEAMRGTIRAANRTDRSGAVFSISLPVPVQPQPQRLEAAA
jgi:two-component system sensor histidine kinase KdpD